MTKDEKMRIKSGSINGKGLAQAFFYDLIKKYIPPGHIESIINENLDAHDFEYTNGWLAKYAEYIAERLTKDSVMIERERCMSLLEERISLLERVSEQYPIEHRNHSVLRGSIENLKMMVSEINKGKDKIYGQE